MTTRSTQLYAGPVSDAGTGLGKFPYTVPSGYRTILKSVQTFCASTGERLIISEYSPAGIELCRLIDTTLPSAKTDQFTFWTILNAGEKLQVWVPGGNGATFVNVSGTELLIT